MILEREFERLDDGLYKMHITINKGPIEGFAKLEEVVPDGFEYKEESTSGAIFTKINGKAKFVWFDLPDDELIDISYNLTADESNVVGLHNITGEFTYIIDDQDIVSKTVPAFFQINSSDMLNILENRELSKDDEIMQELSQSLWQEDNVSDENSEPNNSMNNTVDSLSINESLESENTVSNKVNPENIQTWDNDKADKTKDSRTNQAASIGLSTDSTEMTEEVIEETENSAVVSNNNEQNEELVESVTGISSADEGINYRVQICATKKVAEKNYFKKHKNFNFDVTIENHEGWIKYTTGEYPLYKQAST